MPTVLSSWSSQLLVREAGHTFLLCPVTLTSAAGAGRCVLCSLQGMDPLPSHRAVAVTRFLPVVWLQQQSSRPAAPAHVLIAVLRSRGAPPAKIPAPTSPAQKTSPGPGHGQHVALTQQLSWPGILHGKWLWMVALTSTPAPHCLSTSNARRDAAGWSRLAAVLQRPPSLSALSGHHGQRRRLPCHPHLQFKACQQLPRQPCSPSSRRSICLNLETWKADPSLGEGNRTSQADSVPPRTFLPPSPPRAAPRGQRGRRRRLRG